MSGIAGWVPPTIAIALVVIAVTTASLVVVMAWSAYTARREIMRAAERLLGLSTDARAVARRLRIELTAYASLSAEARGKIKGAIATADRRLSDLDALVEVLQEEAEDTALDVAAMVRAVRRPRSVISLVRAAMRLRRAAAPAELEDTEVEDEDADDDDDAVDDDES